jgi:Protein of unknown function (DUF732)
MSEMAKKISAFAFCVALSAVLMPSASARADTTDAEFVQYLESHGIHLGSHTQTVNMARVMCQDLETGYSQKDEVDQLTGQAKLSQAQAETFIGAATADYCPGKHSPTKPSS